jgi:hypothetical protein
MEPNTEKTTIRPDTSKMVKAKGGTFHKDDTIGNALEGVSVDGVIAIATKLEIDTAKYQHLNRGQQRMTIGNIMRRLVQEEQEAIAKADAGQLAAEEKGEEFVYPTIAPVLSVIRNEAQSFRDAAAKAKEQVAQEKAAAKAAKDAEKDAAKKAKEEAKSSTAAQSDDSNVGDTTLEQDDTDDEADSLDGLEDEE